MIDCGLKLIHRLGGVCVINQFGYEVRYKDLREKRMNRNAETKLIINCLNDVA